MCLAMYLVLLHTKEHEILNLVGNEALAQNYCRV